MQINRIALPHRPPPSPQLVKAALYQYLLVDPDTGKPRIGDDDRPYGVFKAFGNSSDLLFDITDDKPHEPADFTNNRGRIVIETASSSFADKGKLMRSSMTLFCYAQKSTDSAFLAEHMHAMLCQWRRGASIGACIQSLAQFRVGRSTYEDSSTLHYTTVMFMAIVR